MWRRIGWTLGRRAVLLLALACAALVRRPARRKVTNGLRTSAPVANSLGTSAPEDHDADPLHLPTMLRLLGDAASSPSFTPPIQPSPRSAWKPLVTSAVLFLTVVAVAVAQTHAGRNLTNSLGISAPEEPFTELYFADPLAIASLTEQPQHGQSVERPGFVIHNEERRSIDYRWSISIGGIARYAGSQPLGPGQHAQVRQRIVVPCTAVAKSQPKTTVSEPAGPKLRENSPSQSGVQVAVSLQQPRESINYLVDCRG